MILKNKLEKEIKEGINMKLQNKKNEKNSNRKLKYFKYVSPKYMVDKLNNLREKQLDELFLQLEKNVDEMSSEELKNIYKHNFIGIKASKSIINKKNIMEKQGIKELAIDSANTLQINSNCQNRYIKLSKKISNKIAKVLNHPITKILIICGLGIAWFLMYRNFTTATVACLNRGNMKEKIDDAFYYVRMITAVVAFIWMCLELSNTAVKGDMRAIWYIVSKYVILIIAIVGYKSIFNLIDGFFNG